MSSRYWPPASLTTEGRTSDLASKVYTDAGQSVAKIYRPKDMGPRSQDLVTVLYDLGPLSKKILDEAERLGYTIIVTPRV